MNVAIMLVCQPYLSEVASIWIIIVYQTKNDIQKTYISVETVFRYYKLGEKDSLKWKKRFIARRIILQNKSVNCAKLTIISAEECQNEQN